MAWGVIYLAAFSTFVGICLYAALTRCDPLCEPRHDAPDNRIGSDRPFISGDLKASHFGGDTK